MIEIGYGTITILYADGTSAVFDPEELRIRLEKSFLSSETGDLWVAGELVLSVEYALQKHLTERNCSAIQAEEIDDCVERILEDSGFAAAARMFRSQKTVSGGFGKISPDGVEQYLAEKLQLPAENSRNLAEKVISAMNVLEIRRCSPHLILELARHFRGQGLPSFIPPKVLPEVPKHAEQKTANTPVFKIHRSDVFFPSIRAEIDLRLLFRDCALEPPLTEFSLTPLLLPVTSKIDAEYKRLLNGKNDAEYPLLLKLRGFPEFSAHWLCYEKDLETVVQEKRVLAFTAFLRSLMQIKPFKILL